MDLYYCTAPPKRISAANSKKKTLKLTLKPKRIKKVRNNTLALWTYTIVQLPQKRISEANSKKEKTLKLTLKPQPIKSPK